MQPLRMLTPGVLRKLTHEDFQAFIQPSLVDEITPQSAKKLLDDHKADLIDCRYDLEYEDSRISGAQLIPLHRLRFLVQDLDPEKLYIVFCRSGKRSRAAAYLHKERNFTVRSLTGGIRDWPYPIESDFTVA